MTRNIIDRIEARLSENKSDTKTYKTYENAVTASTKLAEQFENCYGAKCPIEFTVVMLPNVGRWTAIYHLSNWLSRTQQGIYVGYFATRGFFSN